LQAITYHRYGSPDVLELEKVDPPAVGDDHVLVRVRAASVNPRDWHYLRGLPYIMRPIGLRIPKDGAFGSDLGPKPANLSFEAAAAVPLAALTALQGLRDHGRVQHGQRVLIIGASGGVGSFAVQLAKSFGAEVTGVCSGQSVEMVRSIGADHVIDYTQQDFTRSGQRYDLILEMAGNRSLADLRRVLTPKGTLVLVGGSGGKWFMGTGRTLRAVVLSPFLHQRLRSFFSKPRGADLVVLKELLEAGKVTPVIDRTFPLSETPEAIRYVGEKSTQGKTVITV
jgi:NADPH:quinone reductase-like Zn-dependent oxidoreductase